MCGICGVVNFHGEPVSNEVLSAMAARLRHRGPDAVGVARPAPWIGLGHTRLKVIDLSERANQPMASQDGCVWIVYNGEVYNYPELRVQLEQFGRRFVSQSDTEVVLQAYEQWGEECVRRLDGMFAFGILDLQRRQLLLARDRTGKKPLFYYIDRERVVFASEIKGLLAHLAVPQTIHARVLPYYLAFGYPPAPETCYEGIHSLPPASRFAINLSDGRSMMQSYWHVETEGTPRAVSRAEAIHEVRERLTEAVRKRLIADVPLGTFLSGGIDSTIVVGLMSRLVGQAVHTFSIGFRGDQRFDETPYARLAASTFQTKHTEFIVEPKAFELLERLVYHHDQPFGDASAIPTFLLCGLAREHVTVALNGDGGDECFAGYRRFQAAVVSAVLPRWLTHGLARSLGHLPDALRRTRQLGELLRFCDAARRPWDERLARWVSYWPEPTQWLRPELREDVGEAAWLLPVRQHLARVAHRSPLFQTLYVNFHEYLPNDLHVKMDRCSMAHGLETRSPFLDTALVEYAFQLPDAMKLRGGQTKAILKEAFTDVLPDRIQQRGKWGFGVPLDAWFRGELRDVLGDLLLAPDARLHAYLRRDAIKHACQAHLRGERNLGLPLWNLLTLEVWLRMAARGVWAQPETAYRDPSLSSVLR